MMPSSQKFLNWANQIMPHRRADWLTAMESELAMISNPVEQRQFAIGCFRVALLEWASSRKGLNYIARGGGAFILLALSVFGIYTATKFGAEPEALAASKLIISLCLFYICGAMLLVTSLKGLKIYAALGFSAAVTGLVFIDIAGRSFEHLPVEYFFAINLEAAGLMAGLFLAAVYLGWLYTPSIHDA